MGARCNSTTWVGLIGSTFVILAQTGLSYRSLVPLIPKSLIDFGLKCKRTTLDIPVLLSAYSTSYNGSGRQPYHLEYGIIVSQCIL